MRPTLEYASSIWSPMASPTSINKLQVMQNAALRACTGCTHDTNIQHLHDETNILPIQKHLQLHASQVRQKAQYPSHPLYRYTTHNTSQRLKKPTTFNNSRYTTNISTDPCTVTTADIKANMRDIHTIIVSQHLAARDNNKILRTHPPQVSSTEENLPRHTRRTLAQLRTNKSPFLISYLHKIDASTHPSPLCPLCRTHEHTTQHLFSCPQIPTTLSALDLWRDPSGVAALLDDWREKLAANPHKQQKRTPPNKQGRVGRQQQQAIAQKSITSFLNHTWCLTEGLIPFALFSKRVPPKTKQELVNQLLQHPTECSNPTTRKMHTKTTKYGKPNFLVIKDNSNASLKDFIGIDFWYLFKVLEIDTAFLTLPWMSGMRMNALMVHAS